jgi:hypothetical protein
MRYQVPQFVDIEDRIIGPLTLKQFLMYVAAVMLLVPIYLVSDMSLFITIAIPVLGVAALFAHFKLHGRSLFAILSHASIFMVRGQVFMWRRESTDALLPIHGDELEKYTETETLEGVTLRDRARALETVGNVVNEDVEDPMAKNLES